MAFVLLLFTVALSLCVVGLIVIALAAILGRLRGDWTLKNRKRTAAFVRLPIGTAWSEASARSNDRPSWVGSRTQLEKCAALLTWRTFTAAERETGI